MLAASSSSRIASQERPRRPSRIRSDTKTQNPASSANTSNLYGSADAATVSFEGTPGMTLAGVMLAGSIGVMPRLPLVMFLPAMLLPLRKNWGMISPKPRVTKAR